MCSEGGFRNAGGDGLIGEFLSRSASEGIPRRSASGGHARARALVFPLERTCLLGHYHEKPSPDDAEVRNVKWVVLSKSEIQAGD